MKHQLAGLALVLALALSSLLAGCAHKDWGPRYRFVQGQNRVWVYVGAEPNQGYPDGEPSTYLIPWSAACKGPCSPHEVRGIVAPAGAVNWPPK